MSNDKRKKHGGGYAGDGKPLVALDENGLPTAKYDKYGNLVTANTGKGKGIMLKEQFSSASKNIVAPSPTEVARGLTRPYWSINDMPLEYIYNSIMEYFNGILEPVYKRLPVLDDYGNPTYDIDGVPIEHTVLVNYAYKNVPTRYGLAQALGVELCTLDNYMRIDVFNSSSNSSIDGSGTNSREKGYSATHQNTYVNKDNHLIVLDDNITTDSVLYKIYGEDIWYNDKLREELRRKTQKDIKLFILKRARTEIMKYHEQRLGLNENVTGSLFALLNSRDGWTNDHTVKVEFPDLLGKQKTVEELDTMVDYEKDFNEKDTPLLEVKDFDFDDDDGVKD